MTELWDAMAKWAKHCDPDGGLSLQANVEAIMQGDAEIERLKQRVEFYRTAAMAANRDVAELEEDGAR